MKKLRPCVHFSGVYVAAPSALCAFHCSMHPSLFAASLLEFPRCKHGSRLRPLQRAARHSGALVAGPLCGAVCTAGGLLSPELRVHSLCQEAPAASPPRMRVASDLIADNGQAELEDRMIRETGNTAFWLGRRAGRAQRRRPRGEAAHWKACGGDQRSMVQAVQGGTGVPRRSSGPRAGAGGREVSSALSLAATLDVHSRARNVNEKVTHFFDMAQYRKYDSQHAHNVASAQCWQELHTGPPRVLAVLPVALLCSAVSPLRIFASGVSAPHLVFLLSV